MTIKRSFTLRQRSHFPQRGQWIYLLLGLVLISGCELPGKPTKKDQPVPDEDQTKFSVLFATHCVGCHGREGKLGAGPPLADPLFLALTDESRLREAIVHGRDGTPMPAFAISQGGTLSEKQIAALVAGIPTLSAAEKPPTDPSPKLGTSTLGDVKRGEEVFTRACAGCHGKDGKGGRFQTRSIGSIHEPAVLQLMSDQLLRRYIITGRDDLGMPGYAGQAGRGPDFKPLTETDIDDLVALLASWRTPAP